VSSPPKETSESLKSIDEILGKMAERPLLDAFIERVEELLLEYKPGHTTRAMYDSLPNSEHTAYISAISAFMDQLICEAPALNKCERIGIAHTVAARQSYMPTS